MRNEVFKKGRPAKYDFSKMKVGDILSFPIKEKAGRNCILTCARSYGKAKGKKFISRCAKKGVRLTAQIKRIE